MVISLKQADSNDKDTLMHLWDLYSYDFSVYNNEDVLPHGNYDFYYNDDFFQSPDKACYFILADNNIAGFASISNACYILNRPEDKCIVDFFVMNKYRKGGVGRKAAYCIFDMFKTCWEVAQYNNNEISKAFWERVVSDYTSNHYEKRSVFTLDYTLQAIIFNSDSRDNESISDVLKRLDDIYHIKLYSRPSEDIVNELVAIAKNSYPALDDVYKNMRRDLRYQDVIVLGSDEEIFGYFMFTSIDGNAEITFAALKKPYQKKGYACSLLRSFIQHMKLCGFEKITVDFDVMENKDKLKDLYAFYVANGFTEAESRPELLELMI